MGRLVNRATLAIVTLCLVLKRVIYHGQYIIQLVSQQKWAGAMLKLSCELERIPVYLIVIDSGSAINTKLAKNLIKVLIAQKSI